MDAAACRVLRGEEEMHLTRKEYDLLLLFLRNRGRALYRDYLYETVWGDDGTGCDTRTLDTHIARLRRKLNLATACAACGRSGICWKRNKNVTRP